MEMNEFCEVAMVNADELHKLYYAEPFKPFDIFLEDGRKVRVKERLHFGWSPKTRILMFGFGKIVDWVNFDRVTQIRPARRSTHTRRPSPGRKDRKGRANDG